MPADLPADLPDQIVITASRAPVAADETSDATSILDPDTVTALGEARLAPLLRLLPSAALAESGPPGTQAQLRIRGAEANHTLLFIDGIKANDPAAGNEARFELLGGALADRIELLRGAQSALWGDAIGGVVALTSTIPDRGTSATAVAEAGSAGFRHASARLATGGEDSGIVASFGRQSSDGIDAVGDGEERDGYRLTTGRAAGTLAVGEVALEAAGFAIGGRSAFDGYDPLTFTRANTDDETANRLAAGRVGLAWKGVRLGVSTLASRNRNYAQAALANWTRATRRTATAQATRSVGLLALTIALDHEREDYDADDAAYGGLTRQSVDRVRTGLVGEARFALGTLDADVAVRRDWFDGSEDATSVSAGLRQDLGHGLALVANYDEGVAQPGFYDLYGYFPGNFVGNPLLSPERARGGDIGLRLARGDWNAGATFFAQRFTGEIVGTFDPSTFLSSTANATRASHRRGVEVEAGYKPSAALSLMANYSFLDADEPEADGALVDETRRPRHRAGLVATGTRGRLTYGASLAWIGAREDVDYDVYPAERVRLGGYGLLSARLAWRASDRLELSLRGTNLADADYQDVVGYNTQGRAILVGLRIAA